MSVRTGGNWAQHCTSSRAVFGPLSVIQTPESAVGDGGRGVSTCRYKSSTVPRTLVARYLARCKSWLSLAHARPGRTGRHRCAVGISCMRRKSTSAHRGIGWERLEFLCSYLASKLLQLYLASANAAPSSNAELFCSLPPPLVQCAIIRRGDMPIWSEVSLSTTMRTRAQRSRVAFRTFDKLRRLYLAPSGAEGSALREESLLGREGFCLAPWDHSG